MTTPTTDEKQLTYRIDGGHPIKGEITCLGAKNFVGKALVAALLTEEITELSNSPSIGEVDITVEMLESIGVKVVRKSDDRLIIDPKGINSSVIVQPQSGSNRIPILLLGALLHKFKEVTVPLLGGCRIGARRVDFHLQALRQFGAVVTDGEEGFMAQAHGGLKGTQIRLPYPSVGATETCLFLSVLAKGRTLISNAAIEPEIEDLMTMLQSMGAIIFRTAGRDIRVEGVEKLHGTRMHVLGDRIEAASWASLACATQGDITVHGVRPEILSTFLSYFQQIGGGVELMGPQSLRFFRRGELKPAVVETDVYPGFSTDWQQPFAVVLTQAEGTSTIHESVYENRFGYAEALRDLGAKIQLSSHCLGPVPCRFKDTNYNHSAMITGPTVLKSAGRIEVPDLRAGLAYVVAAAIAQGTTELAGISYLERGYGNIVPRLSALNLKIERLTV